MNISAIDTPVMEAYTTNAILGGMTMAIELEVAISAVENGAEKPPCSTIAGIRTAPSAATVAGPEPEIAPNTALFMSYAGIYEVDQSFGNTGFCHDVSGQNEERDGKKQEFTDSGVHICSYDRQRCAGIKDGTYR